MSGVQTAEVSTAQAEEQPERCAQGHTINSFGIYCREKGCHRFILFAPEVFQQKTSTFVYASLLIPSSLAAILFSRFTSQVWPLYLFFMFGVLLVYATIFSRGRALPVAALILTGTVLVWLGLQMTSGLLGLDRQSLPQVARLGLPILVYVAFAVGMFELSRRRHSILAIRRSSIYFQTTGALTFGFWGVWLVYLECDLVTLPLYAIAVGTGLLLPLLSMTFLAWQTAKHAQGTGSSYQNLPGVLRLLASGLVVIAGYVILLEPLISGLAFLLGRFLPQAVGHEALPDITLTWLGGPGWRAVFTSLLLMVAITLVAVQSTMEVGEEALDRRLPEAFTGGMLGEKANEAVREAYAQIGRPAWRKFFEVALAGGFYGRIGLQILKNLWKTIRDFIRVAVPVTMFSLLSVAVVLVLGVFRDYQLHGGFFGPVSLWGTGFTAWILVIIACGIAFAAAREQDRDDEPAAGKQQRRIVLSLVETGSSTLMGGLLYFLLSLVSIALLPLLLYPQDSSETFGGFVPGQIYFTNLLISMGALGALVVLTVAFRMLPFDKQGPNEPKETGTDIERKEDRLRLPGFVLAACVLILLGGAATYLGERPIIVAASYAASSHPAANQTAIAEHVPAPLAAACTPDQILLTGYQVGLTCPTNVAGTQVSYHLFGTAADLDRWYAEALANRGIPPATGDCATDATAEAAYTRGERQGRLACKTDRTGVWMIWTDPQSRLLVITRSMQQKTSDLYQMWAAGAI